MKRFVALFFVFLFPLYALAEEMTLSTGKWIVGEDIRAGHYLLHSSSMCVASVSGVLDDQDYLLWIDNKSECILLDGHCIDITLGKLTFTPVEMTEAQSANEHYPKLEAYRHKAILTAYEDVCDLYHSLPLGIYTVGVDIPEGSWRLESWGNTVTTVTITEGTTKSRYNILCPGTSAYNPGDLTAVYLPLREGATIQITNGTGKENSGIYIYPYQKDLADW